MKVCLYKGNYKKFAQSGMGKAILHQETALQKEGIDYQTSYSDDIDIIHLNDWLPKTVRLAKKARRNNIKVVMHAHSTEEDFRNSFRGSNLISPLFKNWLIHVYRQGDVLITPTLYSKQILERYRIKRPIVAISNGIDLRQYDRSQASGERFRAQYGFSEDDKVVISVGHFMKRKGIIDFVRMAERHPSVSFVWFGHSPRSVLTTEVAAAVDTKLPNLHFAGYVAAEALRDAYVGADVFLFMTHEETEGIVLLEAMAMKTQVLIRDIPIYVEFKDGHSLYKANSDADFDQKLKGILDGSLPSTVDAAYEEVKARSLDAIGSESRQVYDQHHHSKSL